MSKQKIEDWLVENTGYFYDDNRITMDETIDIIHQYTKEQSGWVSVEDRLPDEGEEAYMVTDGRYVNITEYDAEDERFLEIPNCALVNITHWMPLPLPPAEEA